MDIEYGWERIYETFAYYELDELMVGIILMDFTVFNQDKRPLQFI